MESLNYFDEFIGGLMIDTTRYFIFAGIPFLLLYLLFRSRMFRFKVQQKFPENKHMLREIGFSLLSMAIFSVVSLFVFIAQQKGYTKIYTDMSEHSTAYFIFSVLAF